MVNSKSEYGTYISVGERGRGLRRSCYVKRVGASTSYNDNPLHVSCDCIITIRIAGNFLFIV